MTSAKLRPWPALALVLAAAAIVLIAAGHGLSYYADDFSYYGRQVIFNDLEIRHFDSISPEYLFIPHNGHLQIGGKVVYEAIFAIFGSGYLPFRIVAVASTLACIALFFALARRRVGDPLALLMAALLAFLGAAWEVQLWPFDMHTTLALVAGLGALLLLESRGKRADPAVCVLLVVSCSFIEVGLVFVAAVASAILLEPGWRRRIWVVAIPAVLYAGWYVWARQYDFDGGDVDIAGLVPSIIQSIGAVAASLTGTMPTGAGADANVLGQTPSSVALGVALIVLVVLRIAHTGFRRSLVPWLVAPGVYWCLIAFSARPEDSSRYVFVGAVLVLLLVAESLRGWRPRRLALVLCAIAVAIAIPANLAKLGDGGGYLRTDAELTRGEGAMFELVGTRGNPDYVATLDPAAQMVGASPGIDMSTSQYLGSVRLRGNIAASLDEVRGANVFQRTVFDTVLADALGVGMAPADAPADSAGCVVAGRDGPTSVELPPEGALVRVPGRATPLGLSRFTTEHSVHYLGTPTRGEWQRIDLRGPDAAPDPWRLFTEAAVEVCPAVPG
jgi:hypothetical protein